MWRYYQEPKIIPPIPVDSGSQGVPSDHSGAFLPPLDNAHPQNNSSDTISKTIQPMPQSLIHEFGRIMVSEDWSCLTDSMDVDTLITTFDKYMKQLIDTHFPIKNISISPYDKPWITEKLKQLRRKCQRVYVKKGRSSEYMRLKSEFDKKKN